MQTWFITGTSSGFGRLLTEKLLARGDRVAATLRKPEALTDLKQQYGDQLWIAPLDVTDTAAVHQTVARAFTDFTHIDVIVNNAAYALFGAAEEASDEQIRRQIDTNVVGSIQVIRAALPHLRAQGGGRILQVSSEGGQITYPNFSYYHTTKWAIEGFVEAVAQEVALFNIELTLIEPGPAKTDFLSGLVHATPLSAYDATPAGAIRRGLTSGNGTFTVGDPHKMVDAMLASVDQHPAPRRLTLGRDAYTKIRASLVERLAALDAQQAVAFSTEMDD